MMKSCVLKPLLHELGELIGAENAYYLMDGVVSTMAQGIRSIALTMLDFLRLPRPDIRAYP
jgi:hypothetical protein